MQALSPTDKKELHENLLGLQNELKTLNICPEKTDIISSELSAAINESSKKRPDIVTIQSKVQNTLNTIKSVGDTIDKVTKWDWTKRIVKLLGKFGLTLIL